jgi:hypothetical protein
LSVALELRNWLLKQMNARDSLDGVVVTVKVAVAEFGPKQVAQRLRSLADSLERNGELPGLKLSAETATQGGQDRRPSQRKTT